VIGDLNIQRKKKRAKTVKVAIFSLTR